MRSSRFPTHLASGFLFAFAAIAPGGIWAADDPHACVAIADDAARLACYDRALGRGGSTKPPATPAASSAARVAPAAAPAAAAVAASPAPAPAAAPAAVQASDPVAEFGLTETAKRAKTPSKPAEPQSISARVVSLSWRKYGEFVVTLDNGQVWEQIEPMPAAAIRIGDPVTVKKALLGSYTLVTAGKVPTKVRRID